MDLGHIVPIRHSEESYLSIQTSEVLARIERDDSSWEQMVPPRVAEIIKAERLFQRAV
jgi:nicotinic acid mononucleotide adenylyltransferase